ncbi:uncharacterized protein LOC133513962 [Syngnathoides biaculeatus]|uniref:uncharacterized protein LOC133513962 n=1 Tax=Syngnathoides biaculeatus TaxID=300417 RepID=UPI002ADE6DD6|nr:uncharacterized protein LOC133513962 [Syngnathoides biaculeatus]
MEAVPSEQSVMAVDLSKSFSAAPQTRNHQAPPSDLAAKPEWYHRAGLAIDSSYTTGSYDGGTGIEPSYVSTTLPPGIGRDGALWCPSFYQADASCEDDSDSGSDVIVLLTAAEEPLLCASFVADGAQLSPAPSSAGCCQGAQNLTSQSSETSSEDEEEEVEESESSADIPPHHARPVVLLANLNADYAGISHFDTTRVTRSRGTRSNADCATLSRTDMTSDDNDVGEFPIAQTTHERPTFPPKRRQDKSVPVECKGSKRIRACPKRVSPDPWPTRRHLARSVKKDTVGVYYESCDSDDTFGDLSDDDASHCHSKIKSDDSWHHRPGNKSYQGDGRPAAEKSGHSRQRHKVGETDNGHHGLAADQSDNHHQHRTTNTADNVPQHHESQSDNSCQGHAPNKLNNSHRHRAAKKSSGAQISSTKQKLLSSPKKTVKRQRCRLRAWCPPSSLFSPPEPQIKLKCTADKEPMKKKKMSDTFCPFVRVWQHENAEQNDVTVVNHQDRQDVTYNKQQKTASSSSGVTPKTSCFRLGRLTDVATGADAAEPPCCLCGQAANTNGLGDLHGPYFPSSQSLAELSDYHDTDKPAFPNLWRHLNERWVHSDCTVWSSQVFLVRGNLYGLEEAEQLARATICCWCQRSGAIMGCSHKGCAGYFHYTCALSSGCVLNEDNLSLRCPQHHMTQCQQQQQHQGHTQRKTWRAARRHVR